jgi:hypothetical protein
VFPQRGQVRTSPGPRSCSLVPKPKRKNTPATLGRTAPHRPRHAWPPEPSRARLRPSAVL